MQKCQLRENEIATWAAKCSLSVCPLLTTTFESLCLANFFLAGQLLSTTKHRSLRFLLSSGLISEQANQIWSRNVDCCVCGIHNSDDSDGRRGPVSHAEHAWYPLTKRVTLTVLKKKRVNCGLYTYLHAHQQLASFFKPQYKLIVI